jgi:hypothetical protein
MGCEIAVLIKPKGMLASLEKKSDILLQSLDLLELQ